MNKNVKSSNFLYHVMSKYNLKRKDLARILDLKMVTTYSYLNGFNKPPKEVIEKLAHHLKEKPETFFSLCYEPNDVNADEAAIPDYPQTRAEIVKYCDSRGTRFDIITHAGTHNYEYYLAWYLFYLMEGKKYLDSKSPVEIIDKPFCESCIKKFETEPERREKMFEITGKWFVSNTGLFFFENQPSDAPMLKFVNTIDEALKYQVVYDMKNLSDIEKDILAYNKKLERNQQKEILKTIKEKIAYNTVIEKTRKNI